MKRPHIFRMELYRSIVNWKFLLIIILIPLVMWANISDSIVAYIEYGFKGYSSIDSFETVMIFDQFKAIMVVFLSGICCYTIGDDLSSRYIRSILARCSLKRYVAAKVLVNGIAILLATVFGFCLFPIITSPIMDFVSIGWKPERMMYFKEVIEATSPMVYVALVGVLFGMYVVAMTTISMWITVHRPSRYMAMAASFGLFYITYSLTWFYPRVLSLWNISAGLQVLSVDGFLPNYLYGIGIFLVITLIGSVGCYVTMKRRVKNGNI